MPDFCHFSCTHYTINGPLCLAPQGFFDCSVDIIYGTDGKNTLKFTDTAANAVNTITLSETDGVIITSNTSVLRFNAASNQLRFRYYKSSSYANQQAIQLYKLEG